MRGRLYESGQVQSLPQRHVSPHRQPPLRPTFELWQPQGQAEPVHDSQPQVFAFFNICSSLKGRLHVSPRTDDARLGSPLQWRTSSPGPCAGIYTYKVHPVEPLTDDKPAPLATLLENHRAFLRYLERRVGDRDLAEDILQDAFAKIVDRPDQAPSDEGIVPWFYRTLRNAAIDQFRRRGAASRAVEAFAREMEAHTSPDPDMEAEICECVSRLAGTLKLEYAEALQAIDVQGTAVKTFAEQRGLSASNAGVRVFRAREALKKRVVESCGTCAEHGCLNCTCQTHS